MKDLIDRQAAIDAMNTRLEDIKLTWRGKVKKGEIAMYLDMRGVIETLPSAQPETAKRIVGKSRDGMTLWYQCDMCNEPVDAQDNYCRGCGRRLVNE